MCGITGIFSRKKINDIDRRISIMNDSLIHRGPDAGGFVVDEKISLGHRRLSIIDTSENANQPMISIQNIGL